MELKDTAGAIVCSSYSTDPATAPVAMGCPAGEFSEQLFDASWNQIGSTTVVVGGSEPAAECPAAFAAAYETFSNPPYVLTEFEIGDLGGGSVTFTAPTEFAGRVILRVQGGGIYGGETGYIPPGASIVAIDAFDDARTRQMWLSDAEVDACATRICSATALLVVTRDIPSTMYRCRNMTTRHRVMAVCIHPQRWSLEG